VCAVAVPIDNADLDGQWITVDRTASESGGRRDIRADLKTRAAERVVAIPDIAMPAVQRLADSGAAGRERSEGRLYGRLINGERGGYLGYAMWRRYLKLAHGYTAAHKDGIVKYTAHELRHVCASLLIASGGSTWSKPATVNDNVDAAGVPADQFQPSVAAGPAARSPSRSTTAASPAPVTRASCLPTSGGRTSASTSRCRHTRTPGAARFPSAGTCGSPIPAGIRSSRARRSAA
jgi:hypothetical protein